MHLVQEGFEKNVSAERIGHTDMGVEFCGKGVDDSVLQAPSTSHKIDHGKHVLHQMGFQLEWAQQIKIQSGGSPDNKNGCPGCRDTTIIDAATS